MRVSAVWITYQELFAFVQEQELVVAFSALELCSLEPLVVVS